MENSQARAIVVVPIYTTALSSEHVLSLKRTVRIIGHHPFAVICPQGLDLTPLDALLQPAQPILERFDRHYFDGVEGYNRLMLSETLYQRFDAYQYLLICQTDAFVFEDKLDYWCSQGYDYIGAPWISSPRNALNKTLFWFNNLFRAKKKSNEYLFKVGNGGFSLRKVRMMQRIVHEQRNDIDHELANPRDRNHHVEDQYFSLAAPTRINEMKIPVYTEAVDFCIDRRPQLALAINGGRLPFACHGFDKRNVRNFWRPIIESSLRAEA